MAYGSGLYGSGIYGIGASTPSGLTVYARRSDGTVAGQMVMWDELTIVDRWRDLGRWTLTTTDTGIASFYDDNDVGIIVRRGDYVLLSGVPDYVQKQYRGGAVETTISGTCDGWALRNLAWGDPDASLSSQSDAYDVRTDYPEDLILGYVGDNLNTRLGMSLTLPTSSNLGTSRTYRARFTPLLEVCQSVVSGDDDIGFRLVQQDDDTIGVEVWQASDLTSQDALFSDQAGTVMDWAYTKEWPTATRSIAAGGDEGAARLFRNTTDSTAESTWDRVLESFTDQRGVDPAEGTAADELDAAAAEDLADKSGKQSFRISISETVGIEYGTDVRVGDLVRAYPAGVQVDDRIVEAEIRVSRDGDEETTLWIGQKDDDPEERQERRAVAFDRRIQQLERVY